MGFEGKGVQHYTNECVRLERQFHAIQAEAARTSPEDERLVTIRYEAQRLVDRLIRMEGEVHSEVARMWEFHDTEVKHKVTGFLASLLSPGSLGDFEAQFLDGQVFYDGILSAIKMTYIEWSDWLMQIGGADRSSDGSNQCALGHENHLTREACLTCGRALV